VDLFSEIEQRRIANAKKLAAFGVTVGVGSGASSIRTIRTGAGITIYTIGYEKRDGDGLMSALRDQGVRVLADVRERATSRRADFRAANLKAICDDAGIIYQPWPTLGSTAEQRDGLHESGDFQTFALAFRSHAMSTMEADLDRLAEAVAREPTALLCYERLHEDCHRSVIAELIASRLDATVIAIQ
jgi:uncharacterized protein (DUF488 family)